MSSAHGPSASPADALPSDPAALQAAIEARRAHLSGTLDELAQRVKPANLATEAKDEAVDRARRARSATRTATCCTSASPPSARPRLAVVVALVVARRRSR